jgi:hypothetical protein
MKVCRTCRIEKHRNEFPSSGYHIRKDGTKLTLVKPDCKPCHTRKQINDQNRLFKELNINFKCVRCGYDKYYGNIDFHHKDSSEKDFNISSRVSISKETLLHEINKCILLCKICHNELHAGLWNLTDIGGFV